MEELSEALADSTGGQSRYVLPFRFRSDSGRRTMHHLIFISKHFRGYEIMKDIMAKEKAVGSPGRAHLRVQPGRRKISHPIRPRDPVG